MTEPTGKTNPRYGGHWTEEAEEILVSNWGHWFPQNVANKINSKLGTRFTAAAVKKRAEDIGISGKTCQGLLTISDAAAEVGLEESTVRKYINDKGLETVGRGAFRYLTDETWQIIQERYKEPPEKTISTADAAKRLNFIREYIVEMIILKKLRAWKCGKRWRVSLADVERMEREQRGTKLIGEHLERKRR